MGSRMRPEPNHKAESLKQTGPVTSEGTAIGADALKKDTPPLLPETASDPQFDLGAGEAESTQQPSQSWYGGSWPRGSKASPVTQVAKESIAAATSVASDIVAAARIKAPRKSSASLRSPLLPISRSAGGSSRSLPLEATTTKLNITSNALDPSPEDASSLKPPSAANETSDEQTLKSDLNPDRSREGPKPNPNKQDDADHRHVPAATLEAEDKRISQEKSRGVSSGWLDWFQSPINSSTQESSARKSVADNGHTGSVSPENCFDPISMNAQPKAASQDQQPISDPSLVASSEMSTQPRSWLSLWKNSALPPEKTKVSVATHTRAEFPDENPKPQAIGDVPEQNTKSLSSSSEAQVQPPDVPKSNGWAFWSRENSKGKSSGSKNEVGKLALAGSPSQSQPENARIDDVLGIPSKLGKTDKKKSLGTIGGQKKLHVSKTVADGGQKAKISSTDSKSKSIEQARTEAKKNITNLVLPSLKQTYRTIENPNLMQRFSQFLHYNRLPDTKHVNLLPNPPRIRRALAIGVHGYFPAPLIRSVLGQPTGTSIRFANGAASAIQSWTQSHGYSCEIEKVALEGEGKIAERINLLWKLMLNWIDNIRKADLVMIACHSQGVPVAMMLVAKLIEFGCVNHSRIGVCALAGVNLGPFIDYKSRWISGSAGELFDFAHRDSQVSKDYEAALSVAVRFGVRILYMGSIDDQLVSLESSTFGTVSHPYIFRAVFVDGRVHAPDFLTHLVGFALKLRNLGISDHGLIRELSSPLAGSLYSGEGHSRIYDDQSVYYLAVEHALETTSIGDIPLQVQRTASPSSQNPYILPFAIRGVLEEEYVRTELHNEITELLKQFEDWKPTSKALKDVKFRLEGVRSKMMEVKL